MFAEFKKFIMRGNVLDLAIGVIIGAAFGKIVTSLVNDILMPMVGTGDGQDGFFESVRQPERPKLSDTWQRRKPPVRRR